MMDTKEEVPPMAEEKQRELAFQQERKAFRLAGVWAVIALLAWGSGVGLQLLPAADRVKRMLWLEFLGFVIAIASLAVCVALARWLTASRRRRQLDAGRIRPDDR
jgi:hypothetical protein